MDGAAEVSAIATGVGFTAGGGDGADALATHETQVVTVLAPAQVLSAPPPQGATPNTSGELHGGPRAAPTAHCLLPLHAVAAAAVTSAVHPP